MMLGIIYKNIWGFRSGFERRGYFRTFISSDFHWPFFVPNISPLCRVICRNPNRDFSTCFFLNRILSPALNFFRIESTLEESSSTSFIWYVSSPTFVRYVAIVNPFISLVFESGFRRYFVVGIQIHILLILLDIYLCCKKVLLRILVAIVILLSFSWRR